MRIINASEVTKVVRQLCIDACRFLEPDMRCAMEKFRAEEPWPIAQKMLDDIIENYKLAEQKEAAICQDTGLAVVFVEIGEDVFVEGNLADAIDKGVRLGYVEGYLRKSSVSDPLFERKNTGDNSPAVVTYDFVMGDQLKITVSPKGAGSENMSRIKMLRPSDGVEGVRSFVLETVEIAGPNPCPPIVIGVGIGGTYDRAALLSKKALVRPLDCRHPDANYSALESELLEAVNGLGIGPQGFGGRTTALAVNIEWAPTHIAQLPCAINIGCHANRHKTAVL